MTIMRTFQLCTSMRMIEASWEQIKNTDDFLCFYNLLRAIHFELNRMENQLRTSSKLWNFQIPFTLLEIIFNFVAKEDLRQLLFVCKEWKKFCDISDLRYSSIFVSHPQDDGIAFFENKLFCSDSKENKIFVFDLAKKRETYFPCSVIGKFGLEDGEFVSPGSLAFDSKGLLYVQDNGSERIQVFNHKGKFKRQWTVGPRVHGLVILKTHIYLLDLDRSLVRMYSLKGKLINEFGSDIINKPQGLCICSKQLYVIDESDKVHIFTSNGAHLRTFIVVQWRTLKQQKESYIRSIWTDCSTICSRNVNASDMNSRWSQTGKYRGAQKGGGHVVSSFGHKERFDIYLEYDNQMLFLSEE